MFFILNHPSLDSNLCVSNGCWPEFRKFLVSSIDFLSLYPKYAIIAIEISKMTIIAIAAVEPAVFIWLRSHLKSKKKVYIFLKKLGNSRKLFHINRSLIFCAYLVKKERIEEKFDHFNIQFFLISIHRAAISGLNIDEIL